MKYWYKIEENIGGWARVSVGELKTDAAGNKTKGQAICGADTGSGYVGLEGEGMRRHAPEMAEALIATVRALRDHQFSSNDKILGALEQELEEKVNRVTYAIRHQGEPIPVFNYQAKETARVGGNGPARSKTNSRIGKSLPAPNWVEEVKSTEKVETGITA